MKKYSLIASLLTIPSLILACSAPPPADGGQNTAGTGAGGGGGGTTPGMGGTPGGTGATMGTGALPGGTGATPGTGGGGPTLGDPPYGHPSDTVQYPTYEGFTLWVAEEFDAPLDLDTDPIWTWSDGGLDEGQVRFVKENVRFMDGKMHLVAEEAASSPAAPQGCSHAELKNIFDKALVSGELRTRWNLFRYGRYEVSMKAPSVQPGNTTINGNYIATLFTFRTPKHQDWREIDIEVTGNSPGALTTNLIYGDNEPAWRPQIANVDDLELEANVRDDFHTYAFEWLPESITWFVDGVEVRKHNVGDGLPIPEKSAKIMMNLWIFDGTGFGGMQLANNQYPMHTEYDWFRFYKWDQDTEYPCATMDGSCLSDADKDLSSNNPCDIQPQFGDINGNPVCTGTCM